MGKPKRATMLRRAFNGAETVRLVVTMLAADVDEVDAITSPRRGQHAARGNRCEFIRMAVAEKLAREREEQARISCADSVKHLTDSAGDLGKRSGATAREN